MKLPFGTRWPLAIAIGLLLGICLSLTIDRCLHPPQRGISLREGLWVCTWDMKQYFPPGSSQSRAVLKQFMGRLPIDAPILHRPICYRMGGAEGDASIEPLLWEFDPATLPPTKIAPAKPPGAAR